MGFASQDPISWQDIDAFVRQTGFRMAPWEIETIEAIDDAFLEAAKSAAPKKPPGENLAASADVNDGRGIKALFRSIGRRKKGKGEG